LFEIAVKENDDFLLYTKYKKGVLLLLV